MEPQSVAVHSGSFHSDDVFAVAILRMLYPDIEVMRTRDEQKLEQADLRVDVGDKYNPETGDFDHHQEEFDEVRENGIPYASAGLIWKHFGPELVDEEVWEYIDKRLMQFLDAMDCGVKPYEAKEVDPYTLDMAIENRYTPADRTADSMYTGFLKAVDFAQGLLHKEIERKQFQITARQRVREAVAASHGEYVVLNEFLPWKEVLIGETDMKYVLYPDEGAGTWHVRAVNVAEESFESRLPFPEPWRGLRDDDLAEVSGVDDAHFCHRTGFLAVAGSKKGAIELVEKALNR